MKILAVDTATKSCSVAVTDGEVVCAELTTVNDQTHSKHLLEMVHTVTQMAGLSVTDLSGFAVTIGPGSFTGLRIGISSIKGLAVAFDKPVVGISSLEALAQQTVPGSYLVVPCLDARKGEIYFAHYRFVNGLLTKEKDEVVRPPDQVIKGILEPCIFVGSGAQVYQELIRQELSGNALIAPQNCHIIRASTVAYLGMKRLENDDVDDINALVPHYIRQSDAELNFTKRMKASREP
jgi:tRNA threonylcarbamoyladenosine biosynthesis protein TsaB